MSLVENHDLLPQIRPGMRGRLVRPISVQQLEQLRKTFQKKLDEEVQPVGIAFYEVILQDIEQEIAMGKKR